MIDIHRVKRVVVKVGTSTLTHATGATNFRRIEQMVRVLADLKNSGKEIVLVSSGAVAVGVGVLGLPERPKDTPTRQACAAVGQCELMYIYDRLFAECRHRVAQVLMTFNTIEAPVSNRNVRNALSRLLEMGIIPVINENDAVAVDEIEISENNTFGDNDTLSAIVGKLCDAELLVVLSDIDGLYDRSPKDPGAKLVRHVSAITGDIRAAAGGRGSALGTGGMATKLNAAERANQYGFPMVVINGKDPKNLYRLFDGEEIGTIFDFQTT